LAKYIVEDFNHFGGIHCETSAVRKIFLYNDLPISEEMLFGLAGGIGFIYWYVKQMPAPMVGGRGGGRYFIENAARRAGAQIEVRRTTSSKKGYDLLIEKLTNNEPTVVYADMAYLPYMGVPEDAHFGQHVFVIYGIDEDEDTVYISDRGQKGVTVSIEDLKKARGSKFPPWPPQHASFDFTLPKELNITKETIKEALQQCIDTMLNPPIKNIGISGFKKWADLVVKWPVLFPGEKLWEALYQGIIYIETGGTGGSSLRPMYCRFLEEVDPILQIDGLNEVIDAFRESAKLWSEIASLYLPEEYPTIGQIKQKLLDINSIFEKQENNALNNMIKLNQEIEKSKKEILKELKEAPIFLPKVRDKIMGLQEVEKKAFTNLKEVIEKVK